MSALRSPKCKHPEEMCFECARWEPYALDWGECDLIAQYVPGDEYQSTYAYAGCWFERSMFSRKGGRMNPQKVDSWKCSSCGRVYRYDGKDLAEKCCTCQSCGGHAGDGRFKCFECVDAEIEQIKQERYDKARKVPWDEYDGAGIYVEGLGSEYFFGSWHPSEIVGVWESYNEEPFPGFGAFRIYGVYSTPIELDVDALEQLLNDGAYEDYELDEQMHDDLVALCDSWNAKHGDKTYWPDDSVAITYEGCDER